jgi:hypothetical protein
LTPARERVNDWAAGRSPRGRLFLTSPNTALPARHHSPCSGITSSGLGKTDFISCCSNSKAHTINTTERPHFVEPMLARRINILPEGAGWAFEVRWDGYRIQAIRSGPAVRLRSLLTQGSY